MQTHAAGAAKNKLKRRRMNVNIVRNVVEPRAAIVLPPRVGSAGKRRKYTLPETVAIGNKTNAMQTVRREEESQFQDDFNHEEDDEDQDAGSGDEDEEQKASGGSDSDSESDQGY